MDLPKNENEIKCVVLLHLIIQMESFLITHGEPAYGPERKMFNERLERYKTEYFNIINNVVTKS